MRRKPVDFGLIAAEARALLEPTSISMTALDVLTRMQPTRQVEAARLMRATVCYSTPYLKALIGATNRSLVLSAKEMPRVAMRTRKKAAANKEITSLAADLARLESVTAADLLKLFVACQFAERIVANQRVRKYLEKHRPAALSELTGAVKAYWDCEFLQFGPPV